MSSDFDLDDAMIDNLDCTHAENTEELGFISNKKDQRRNVRRNIEEMLDAKALRDSMKEIFDEYE